MSAMQPWTSVPVTESDVNRVVCLQVIKDTVFNMSSMSSQRSGLADAATLVQQAISASPDVVLAEPMQE